MKKSLVTIAFLAACVALVSTVSCTPHRAYRVPMDEIRTSSQRLRDDAAHRAEVEKHSIEEHSEFSLGFVEFDDQGDLWEPRQVDALEEMIRAEGEGEGNPGVVIVVFVHGWKHNASVCDENVTCFREVLIGLDNAERLHAVESRTEPRRVVGVYLGWRGLSVTPKILKEFSFYARKATAHRVGDGRVVEVLSRLEVLRDQLNADGGRSRLVIVGHSFGGAVTFSALSNLFEDRLARSLAQSSEDDVIASFGDLVVLVNPAFEAARYSSIHNQSFARREYSPLQPANLMVVTSESDTATKKAFPAGRYLATIFAKTQDAEQKKALRTAVGHYKPYRTHFMQEADARGSLLPDVEEMTGEARGAADCICSYIEVGSLTSEQIELAAGVKRDGYAGVDFDKIDDDSPDNNPFPMVGTTDTVVTAHNGIYNRVFIDFLRSYVLEMEERRDEIDLLAEEAAAEDDGSGF